MKKILFLTVLLAFAATASAQSKASSYSMSCDIEGDSLNVAVWYYWDSTSAVPNYVLLSHACTILVIDDFKEVPYRRHGDTVFLLEQHNPVRFVYSIPLAALRTEDGVIDLQREDNWYPHRNDEVEYVMTSMWADDYLATLNGERLGVDVKTDDKDGIYYIIEKRYDGLHLILTPKNSQSDLSSIVSDMRNEVNPWMFEIRLSGLPGFYSLTGKKFTPGGAYDVVPLEASVNVEPVDNNRVRISGTVVDSKTGEQIPYFSVYAVDTNAAKEYIIKSKVTEGNFDGSYSFTTKRKDGQMFIIHTVGYAELLLQLHCSY